jgi:AbrB family looped-hinge helix DNA binding protein
VTIARSKITAQGQISVPAEVRKALGAEPGSILEWEQEDGKVVVRRVGKYTFDDIHRALFGDKKVKRQTFKAMNEAKARHASERYVRSIETRQAR